MTFAQLTTLARSLYRDEESAMLLGVCAGLADRFRLDLVAVRVLAALAFVFFTLPAGVLYLTAGMLLPRKPLHFHGEGAERKFWRSTGSGRNAMG